MSEQRTHHAASGDGTTIGGTVHGQGPPLVFVHGILGDGDIDWEALVPRLADRFTCHLPSTRGRGLSGDHPDHGREGLIEDITAYVDSLGEASGVVGFSSGGALAFAATAQSDAVAAVAAHEPAFTALLDEDSLAKFQSTVTRVAETAAAGDLSAASRVFADLVCHDEEVVALESAGYIEAAGRCIPALLADIQQGTQHEGPSPDDPVVLGRIVCPVLVLHGPRTALTWFSDGVQHVADHVRGAQVGEIPGAGHYAPLTHPEPLAEALDGFFAATWQPA